MVVSTTLAEFKTIAIINTLRSCQLFTGLPAADLERIAAVTVPVGGAWLWQHYHNYNS